MAEPFEMPFGLWTRVGPRNRVLDGGPRGNFEGEKWRHIVTGTPCHEVCENSCTGRDAVWDAE